MKAIAPHWINYNGTWHKAGEAFDVLPEDAEEMGKKARLIPDEPEEAPEKPEPEPQEDKAEPAKRGRKRKA